MGRARKKECSKVLFSLDDVFFLTALADSPQQFHGIVDHIPNGTIFAMVYVEGNITEVSISFPS